ncbi:MAG: hypothetical protein ACO26U_05830 [Burkholderiaceae bacterium]
MHASALFVVKLHVRSGKKHRRKPGPNAPRHLRGTQASLLAGNILTQILCLDQIQAARHVIN